jgi:hypothetical protein
MEEGEEKMRGREKGEGRRRAGRRDEEGGGFPSPGNWHTAIDFANEMALANPEETHSE